MKKLKRILAFALVLCMLCSFLPAGAFAAGNDAPAITGTYDAPFERGRGGSNSFRIPAIVTLSDGTLVAAADARWNTTYDGGGLDTMVAISRDGGESWTHSFANYLGDNGNEYNGSSSTCFIDPSLAVYTTDANNDGIGEDTIFMLCDLYPYGVALNGEGNTAPSTDVGFNADGKLLLSGGYYLDGTVIRDADGNEVSGLTVDAHFNVSGIYNGNEVNSNLFFSDSPFKVVRTGFLYLTKSTDGGESWSDPELLNLKTADEQVCLVGPGGGMVTSNGVIVFPVYSYSNGIEHTGLIYSEDGGQTWERSASLDMHSSEADAVELDNGELRVFFRNKTGRMHYADYDLTTNSWDTPVDTGVKTNSNTELSAITYSLGVEHNGVEKTVILVSCPASANLEGSDNNNGSWRTSGRIFAGLVDPETYEMSWLRNSYPLTPVATSQLSGSNYTAEKGFFAYSSMTQKYESGDLAVLYEDNQFGWGDGNDTYYTIAYQTVTEDELAEALGVTFAGSPEIDVSGTEDGDDTLTKESLPVTVGSTATAIIDGVCLENGSAEDEFASIEWVGTEEEPFSAATLPTTSGSIEAYISDGKGNYLTLDGSSLVNVTDIAKATKWSISYQDQSSGYNRYRVKSGDYYVALVNGQLVASTTSSNINHFYTADKGFFGSSTNGGSSVWQYKDTSWIVGNTGDSNGKAYTYTPTHTTVTVTGKKLGYTSFLVGNTQYDITVNSTASKIVDVTLKLDETKTFTNKTDNYVNAEENVEPDDAIVGMKLNGVEGVYTSGGFINLTDLNAAQTGKYIIKNSQSGKLVNNTNDNGALHLDGSQTSFTKSAVWTITASGNGYTVQDLKGKYMTIGNNSASVVDGEKVLTFTYNSDNSKYVLADGSYKLNQYGGSGSTRAAGWNGEDNGSRFEIHRFTGTLPSTEITFEGVLPGKTIAVVGDTQYNITVEPANTVDVSLKLGQTKVITDNTGNYADEIRLNPDANIAKMTVTGETTTTKHLSEKVSAIESGRTYVLYNKSARKLMNNQWASAAVGGGGSDGLGLSSALNNFQDNDCWTIKASGNGYTVQDRNGKYLSIARGKAVLKDEPVVLNLIFDNTDWTIDENNFHLNNFGGAGTVAAGWSDVNDTGAQWEIYEVITSHTYATDITFEAVSEGTTTAVVGTTLYTITVAPKHDVVNIELEVGESFTYTDTTGNHTDRVTQEPDETKATMTLIGTANTTKKVLVPVTANTFSTGKHYVIENVQAKEIQADHSVLTSEVLTYGLTGLGMNGPLDVATSQTWSIIPDDNYYQLFRNGEYAHIGDQHASMASTPTKLTFDYVEGKGWLIHYNNYYLCDLNGAEYGEAFGTTNASDPGNYWNIYEVTDQTDTEATKITFHGVEEGNTYAIVGNTRYNITVVPVEVDDEVMNSATDIWTVDPEVQRQRYNALTGLHKDLYTNESWKAYEAARQEAYKKLVEVSNRKYSSKADADAALKELTDLIDALEEAKNALVDAVTISVHYTFNGTELDIREYKIAASATSVTLPEKIVVNDIAYRIPNTTLNREGAETTYYVEVTKIGNVGEGFVASGNINLGIDHNGHNTVCELKDTTTAKKITEMTLTVGIYYDLDLAIEMRDGYTVEWVSDDASVATVDDNGNVTAADVGTTNITATVKDANGNIVEVNYIPVTVFPKGSADRYSAFYIEDIANTTVWCVVNADTEAHAFEVIEGELIYGQFDTTVSDGTKTTAMSFFGDPDEAHALVYMKSTDSDDHYYLLHDDDGNLYDGTKTPNGNYYVSGTTGGAGYWQAMGLNNNQQPGWDTIKEMVEWAINQGCDGGLGFTRRLNEKNMASNLSFASDPMARIEKTVDGVLPTTRKQSDYRRYTENMVAAVHELVYFKITVTLEVPSVWLDEAQTQSAITYSNSYISDTVLPGAYLYTKELDQADGTWDGEVADAFRHQDDDITDELNAPWTTEEKEAGKRVLEYYLMYEIQESDIPKFYIDNIANLNYNYRSYYSTGAQAGTADAEARISVVGSAIDSVVIDFGQSFTYESHNFTSITDGKTYTFTGLTNIHLKGAFVDGENDVPGITESKASATYGDVTVTREQLLDASGTPLFDDKGYPEYEYTVTYTPTSILQGADAVQIFGLGENNQEKVINGFLVYPASSVYYEEGFLNTGDWKAENAKKATEFQTFELLGMSMFDEHGTLTGKISNKKNAYGYDSIYDGIESTDPKTKNAEVVSSSIYSNTVGDTAEFTFTGTGFELFADCTEDTGYVSVEIINSDKKTVKIMMVNTVVKAGTTGATSGQSGNMGSLPIVSIKDLTLGTYTVKLTKIMADNKSVYIDGVRIFNPLSDSSVYTVDLEDNPEFYQLRDAVLNAIDIQDYLGDSMYVADLNEGAKQVYAGISTDTEAPTAILSSVGGIYTGTNEEKAPQDLLDNGPKNEVYLWPGQTLTFNVKTNRIMQVGLKAPADAAAFGANIRDSLTDTLAYNGGAIYCETDMFYYLTSRPVEDTENVYTVSITNSGPGILAVTDLKVCDDPNAVLVPLTQDNIRQILIDAGYTDGSTEPETPDEPLPFLDVPEDSFYYDSVAWALKNQVTTGLSASHFGPEVNCNRAQAITFLWRAFGSPEPTISDNPFVDVEPGSFYEKAVLWAVEKGITTGTDATHFNPMTNCSRATVVTFLYRTFESPDVSSIVNPFSDVPADAWYTAPILWAVEQGITTGIGDGYFGVDNVCNRAQIVTFLYRALN